MTAETKLRLDELAEKIIGCTQIIVFICLFYFSVNVAIGQTVRQQEFNDATDSRLTKVETILDDKVKQIDDTAQRTSDLEKEVLKLQYSTDNILKLLYWIGGAVGTIVLETAHRVFRPAFVKKIIGGS